MDGFLQFMTKHTRLFRVAGYLMILLSITLVVLSRGETGGIQAAVAVLCGGLALFALHERAYAAGQIAAAGGVDAFLAQPVTGDMPQTYREFAALTGISAEYDSWCAAQTTPQTIGSTEEGLNDVLAAVYGVAREDHHAEYTLKKSFTGEGNIRTMLTLLSTALILTGIAGITSGLGFTGPDWSGDFFGGVLLLLPGAVLYWLVRYREKRATVRMMASPVTTLGLESLMHTAEEADIHDEFCTWLRTVAKPVTFRTAADWLVTRQKQRLQDKKAAR